MSSRQDAAQDAVLAVEALSVGFPTPSGVVDAVDHVSLELRAGETLGIVGESGCGKSVMALAVMRLLDTPPAVIGTGSRVVLQERNLLSLTEPEMRAVRGDRIAMIFQEPMTSLNPVLDVGRQLVEVFRLHRGMRGRQARDAALSMLEQVRLPDPARRLDQYPHELSGGMRQRVMIAMALACRPAVLLADEPTTALDVTVQAQILDLLLELKETSGTAIMLITHDLGVVAETAQRVAVMYAGQIVEEAPVARVFAAPRHPYTQGLLAAAPKLGRSRRGVGQVALAEIPGIVPPLAAMPAGCRFVPRCALARDICHVTRPPLEARGRDHKVACWAVAAEAMA